MKTKKVYRIIDIIQSMNIACEIKPQPGFCWHNAVRALRTTSLHLEDALYVEGYFVTADAEYGGDIRLPHGWLESPDGTILDPTFAAYPELSLSHWYEDDEPRKYVTQARYSLADLKDIAIESLPLFRTPSFE